MPKRIQLEQTSGPPDGAIVVSGPSRWGNPFQVGAPLLYGGVMMGEVGDYDESLPLSTDQAILNEAVTAARAVDLFRDALLYNLTDSCFEGRDELRAAVNGLRGHDLACWCPLDQPCHADVLLELANA